MRFTFSFIATLATCILCSGLASAQNTSIRLIDSNTEKGMPYANVVLYKLDGNYFKGLTTDGNGQASFDLTDRVTYKISFIGYESMEGQISKGEHLTLEMIEQSGILDAVVVTGQYGPQKADQSIYKVDVVDSKQMQQRGINNLAEALSNEVNLRVNTNTVTGTTIEMQGMSGENIKFLIDGVPIVGRVDGNIDLSQINMDNVDHVEIIQGPMSVVYGTSAIAGVINIITKKNTTHKNFGKINGYADNKYTYNFGAYGSMIRGNHAITVSGNRNMFQGTDINLDEEGNLNSTDDRRMEFKSKLTYNAELEYAYRKKDFSVSVNSSLMNSELRDYTNIGQDFYYFTLRSINKITLADKLTENLSYNVVGSYTYFNRDVETLIQSEVFNTTSTRFDNTMTRGNFTFAKGDSKIAYQFGWDINHEIGKGERISEDSAKITDYAAFASAQWKLLKSLSFQPGLRFIYNTSFAAPIIPSLNIQYRLFEDLNVRVSYAKGFRAPSLKELYLNFQDVNHDITGNQDLLAETTNSYNASLSYWMKREVYSIRIEPSFFFNDGKDVISLVTTPEKGPTSATYRNLDGQRHLGGNLNVTFKHQNGMTLSAGYSLTSESFEDGDDSWSDPIRYYNVTVNAQYQFKSLGLVTMANYKLYGETPGLVVDIDTEELYNVFTEAYSDLEITFGRKFLNDRLNVVIGGKNLFDNYTSRTYGYRPTTSNPNDDRYSAINLGRTYFTKLILSVGN